MALGKPDMKILVVDDFPTMRRIVKTLLRQLGYTNIIEAEDGELAYKLLKATPDIEFIVSDWNMPQMTGLDLLKKLRADDRYKALPFLMVTAEAEQGNVVIAVKAGVSNFVVKPFSAQVLQEKIAKIFKFFYF